MNSISSDCSSRELPRFPTNVYRQSSPSASGIPGTRGVSGASVTDSRSLEGVVDLAGQISRVVDERTHAYERARRAVDSTGLGASGEHSPGDRGGTWPGPPAHHAASESGRCCSPARDRLETAVDVPGRTDHLSVSLLHRDVRLLHVQLCRQWVLKGVLRSLERRRV